MPRFKTLTMDDIIKAAEKNGFEWTQRKFFNGRGPIVEACVIGQAALNANVSANSLLKELGDTIGFSNASKIWHYNDFNATSYEDAVDNLKKVLSEFQGRTVTVKVLSTKREIIRKG